MKNNIGDVAKSELGEEKIAVLTAIFKASKGYLSPEMRKSRFRADNPQWMDTLDQIGTDGLFLTLDKDYVNYRVKAYALPIIDDPNRKDRLSGGLSTPCIRFVAVINDAGFKFLTRT
jgi:hypothetical protein